MLTETHSYELDVLEQVAARLEELETEVTERQETENSLTEWVNELTNKINKLETPPTAEEVCEALQKCFGSKKVYYSSKFNSFLFELENGNTTSVVYKGSGENIIISYLLPPYLITLIGRFYEAQQ